MPTDLDADTENQKTSLKSNKFRRLMTCHILSCVSLGFVRDVRARHSIPETQLVCGCAALDMLGLVPTTRCKYTGFPVKQESQGEEEWH